MSILRDIDTLRRTKTVCEVKGPMNYDKTNKKDKYGRDYFSEIGKILLYKINPHNIQYPKHKLYER